MKAFSFLFLLAIAGLFAEPKIEMIDSNPLADLYQLKVTGFEEGEKIHFCSQSLHEVIEHDLDFPAGGELVFSSMVAVLGKAKGTAHLTITGEKSGSAELSIDWVNPKILEYKATACSGW